MIGYQKHPHINSTGYSRYVYDFTRSKKLSETDFVVVKKSTENGNSSSIFYRHKFWHVFCSIWKSYLQPINQSNYNTIKTTSNTSSANQITAPMLHTCNRQHTKFKLLIEHAVLHSQNYNNNPFNSQSRSYAHPFPTKMPPQDPFTPATSWLIPDQIAVQKGRSFFQT